MKITILAAAAAFSLAFAASANAETYKFTFAGGAYDILNGTFTTSNTANVDGSFNITSGGGTLISPDVALPRGVFTLLPGSGMTADNQSSYSNIYTPGSVGFGGEGAEFTGSKFELNIYNGTLGSFPACAGNCASVPGTPYFNPGDVGSLTISAIPEPSVWIMMLGGIALVGAALRFGRKRNGFALAA